MCIRDSKLDNNINFAITKGKLNPNKAIGEIKSMLLKGKNSKNLITSDGATK